MIWCFLRYSPVDIPIYFLEPFTKVTGIRIAYGQLAVIKGLPFNKNRGVLLAEAISKKSHENNYDYEQFSKSQIIL